MKPKHYLALYTVQDGEHEYTELGVLKAENSFVAGLHARHHEHAVFAGEYDEQGHNVTTWGFGDGTTGAQFDRLRDLTKRHYDDLLTLGVALDLDEIDQQRQNWLMEAERHQEATS